MKETDCLSCVKCDVCKYKTKFKGMVDKAYEMNLDEEISNCGIKYTVNCKYFIDTDVFRGDQNE